MITSLAFPIEKELSIALIKEELKSRKIFHALHEIGLDDCYFQPDLDHLILKSMGLYDGTDETFLRYFKVMNKCSRKVKASQESIEKQAERAYGELMEVK